MRTLPPRSSAFSFALVLFATLVVFPLASRTAYAQSSSALACSPCNVNFGNVTAYESESAVVTLTNKSASALTITSKDKTGPWAFSVKGLTLPYKLSAGSSVAFNLVFAPRTLRTVSATFTFLTSTSSSVVVNATGTGISGGGIQASPVSLGFGSVSVGSSSVQSAMIKNMGKYPVVLSQVSNSSSTSTNPFSISGLTIPLTVAVGQSVTFSVSYRPLVTGSQSGAISVITSNGNQISISESGTGTSTATGQLSLSPTSLNFGSIVVGSSLTKNLSLSASGSSVTVNSGTISGSEYSVSGISLPMTLSAGQSVPVAVTFRPQSSGTSSANLSFSANLSNSGSTSVGASLTGTGMAALQHSVALNWNSSSSSVVGYNIYRGGNSGGPYNKLSSSLDSSTSYMDQNVQAGATYYYVVTSVDGSGTESVFSNQVKAVVPTP